MMPYRRPDQDQIKDAVQLACRAPSIYNSQPWRWEIADSTLHLYSRRNPLRSTDPTGREMLLSVGVVLGHLRVVMEGLGWYCDTTLLPDPNHSGHVAEIMFRPSPATTAAQVRRLKAIAERRTDRLPMTPPTNWVNFCRALTADLADSEAVLDVLDETSRSLLEQASVFVESERAYDSPYQAELTWWSHRGESATDGIPDSALITAAEYERVGLARQFPPVRRSQRHATVAHDAAEVVVLSTISHNLRDLLTCGQALATVLIEATGAGYATCTVSHVTEIPESRAMIGVLTATSAIPQVLVRIGTSSDRATHQQTPRRAVDDVVTVVSRTTSDQRITQ
ncbi:NAD(P)H nitroreductase [Williamsia sp.]|uniref:Acg family FMN-binding oxidoreductase n=1 Tax=Williamsia sp. TaxID=1872085 RepID=UPI001A1EB6DB|nr:NAD(P)H nitroreductase [Williamsia sp.]MBJ7287930.1 NAD(P)H nitroreductase [Williamsia sp.]